MSDIRLEWKLDGIDEKDLKLGVKFDLRIAVRFPSFSEHRIRKSLNLDG